MDKHLIDSRAFNEFIDQGMECWTHCEIYCRKLISVYYSSLDDAWIAVSHDSGSSMSIGADTLEEALSVLKIQVF